MHTDKKTKRRDAEDAKSLLCVYFLLLKIRVHPCPSVVKFLCGSRLGKTVCDGVAGSGSDVEVVAEAVAGAGGVGGGDVGTVSERGVAGGWD